MKSKLFPFLSTLFFLGSVSAAPVYLWDNQEGLIKGESCEVMARENIPFRISGFWGRGMNKSTENLRNYKGVRQSHLVNGSLVKIIKGRKKKYYDKVEVVGKNITSSVQASRWFSERLDKGYLFSKSLLPMEDYILTVNNKNLGEDSAKTLGVSKESFWRVESQASYFNMKCANKRDREYTVFRVYDSLEDADPTAFVGVYWDETKLFKEIGTQTYEAFRDENLELGRAYNLQGLAESSDLKYVENAEDINTSSSEKALDLLALNKSLPFGNKSFNKSAPSNFVEDKKKNKEDRKETEELDTPVASIESEVCVAGDTLNVRSEKLNSVVFRAKQSEKVKIFQDWEGSSSQVKSIDGVEYTFVKVEFAQREESDQKVGWIAEKFISPKGQCKYTKDISNRGTPVDTTITGLDDPKCCEFPTVKKPTHSYTSGMRRFNARRGGGKRSHAACDLYRYKDEPTLAVAPGKVIRNLYYFYQGTYALEVKHSGGFIVRYGELTGKQEKGVSKGKSLKMGQRIGYIGKVNSNCCRPMLHFELFKGTGKGPLSTGGNKYKRRSDLLNPTNYLLKWEGKNF